jgi:hypothetical protein
MGAGTSKNKNLIDTFQETVSKTITKTMQTSITNLMTTQIQSSTNKNTINISDIVCGGDVKIGNIKQNIIVAQDLGSISSSVTKTDISSAVSQALDATQAAVSDMQKTPDFQPFFGEQDNENVVKVTNSVRNEVMTETNITDIYQEFIQQVQEAQNINKAQIKNIVCGGNFELGDIDQNIQAMQVASKLSEKISELVFSSKTYTTTVSKQTSTATMKTGIAGVFDSIGKAISGIVDSVGGVIGKVGGIYAVIVVAVILAVVGVIIVVVMNIGSIGSAVSGVVDTAGKSGLIPPGGLGKVGKMGRVGRIKIPKVPQ